MPIGTFRDRRLTNPGLALEHGRFAGPCVITDQSREPEAADSRLGHRAHGPEACVRQTAAQRTGVEMLGFLGRGLMAGAAGAIGSVFLLTSTASAAAPARFPVTVGGGPPLRSQ